jgi:nucleoside-diphosphate-sugar epimerase
MPRHAFIIGGTGQIGRKIAEVLLEHGWSVTLSHRGRRPELADLLLKGAKFAAFDRNEDGALRTAISGGADAVIDTIAYTPEHADQLVELSGNAGAIAVISSASVYQDYKGRTLDEAGEGGFPDFSEPIKETQQTVQPGPQTYSTLKAALEERLLTRSAAPVTILRPCAIYGPHSQHPREYWFVKRMIDQRPVIPLALRGESRFHTSSVENIAALALLCLEKAGTRVFNIADPEALTLAQIGAVIARCLDFKGKLHLIDNDKYPVTLGATPWSVPAPFTLNMSAAMAFGYQPVTGYAEGVGAMCKWLVELSPKDWRAAFPGLAAYPNDQFDYAAEDVFFKSQFAAKDP